MQPPAVRGKKNPDTELRPTVGRSIASFLCTRPHIIQGGLAERGKLAPRATSCHGLLRCSSDKCCCDSLSTDTVTGAAWSGQEQKPCLQRCEEQRTRIYWENVILRRPSGPASCVSTRGSQGMAPTPELVAFPYPGRWDRRSLPLWALLPSVMG